SIPDEQVVRSSVPIRVDGETVGIMYGIIRIETINEKYSSMAAELDAQLFVYDKENGKFIIDTINKENAELSWFKNREYNDGYSYEEMVTTDKGYSSFKSIITGEDLYIHYSTIEDFNWGIMLARYESQVFAKTHDISRVLLYSFFWMLFIMFSFVSIIMANERRLNSVTECASDVRKELLETMGGQNNIRDALVEVCRFAGSRSAIFFDTDGEFYHYISPECAKNMLSEKDRQHLAAELFRYATAFYKTNGNTVNILCIKPNRHLVKTNPSFYQFLKEHAIREISFSATINKANHITVLATINSKYGNRVRMLAEKVSACFSMALYNKNHLDKTELAATTDPLTGVLNRVVYNKDLVDFDNERAEKFSCIYVDVNELHLRNNKHGHAAGDEMLLYIANTLKEVFYGHKVYRIGGDEFLVFTRNINMDMVKKRIEQVVAQLKPMGYHVAIGFSYRTQNTNTEEVVREAEARMYEAKAQYYQNKEQKSSIATEDKGYVQTRTGILEIDTMLSVMKEHYNGIYRVSLDTDKAYRILMPAYLGYNENEEHFSALLGKYICDTVSPDFHRAVMSFMNYDALKSRLLEGKTPKITYKKTNGETVILSVYKLDDGEMTASNTLWVFAKD
ncbi:MAG: GGDEF domain-containing protein, partial [Clostridia bacterium]|nr:GGDEF domain-containing protein [Clostridia bacterium]